MIPTQIAVRKSAMVKHLLLLAFTAHTFFWASSTERSSSYRREGRSCRANEIWVRCPDAVCVPKTCNDLGFPVPCYDLRPNGKCPSKPGCICKEGFVRNCYGICVLMDQCPVCENPNEIFDPCPAPCPPRRCDVDEALILCLTPPKPGDPECKPGCRCEDGFVRNHTGICIPKDQCPKCTRPNEVFDPCIAPCPPRRCDVDERVIKCAAPPKLGDPRCKAGCRCADGYKLNYEGVCIPAEECPSCKRPHEVFKACPVACPPQTCESIGKKYHCPRKHPVKGRIEFKDGGENINVCGGQCVCEDGYFRNKIGECISEEDCLKCPGPHEFYSCGPACDNVCGLLHEQNQTHCPIVNIVCNQKCYCERGYARDENNICIPIEDCDVPNCGPNERYEVCPPFLCQALNCTQVGRPIACPAFAGPGCPEKPACICKDGYARDKRGICVPVDQCPQLCPKNEYYSDCIQGNCSPQNCTQLGFPISCPRINPKYCKSGCLCEQGFVRNARGVCIPAENCPSCGGDPNKVIGCGVFCNQRCSDVGKEPGACITICYENACDCRKGTYLDENTGLCVPSKHCSPQCPKNEWYSDCVQGNCSPQNCTQLGFPVSCPRINPKDCRKGCLCEEGFVRNNEGVCIPSRDCDSCGGDPNKVTGCGVFCNQRCRDIGEEPGGCIAVCYENACDCREGTFLDENTGFCVPAKNCSVQCPVNEWYSECVQGNCSPENCSQLGFPIACPRINPDYCKKGCLCKQGYARDEDGICIPTNECPSCRGDPNAQAGCGGYCNRRCSDIGKEPGACILICEINGCDCKEGHYFDDNIGKCVRPEQCTNICEKNEVFNDCLNPVCTARKCTELGFPLDCESPCEKGCVCKDGYVRNGKGRCIPVNQCPSCGGDSNATSGCGVNCGKRCSDIGKGPVACPLICKLNSCDCKKGYYYDSNRKKCVKSEDCSTPGPICLEQNNEVYSNCINGGCSRKNCSQYGKPVPCVKIDPRYCIKGCLCKEGYLRAANGKCVPQENCPEACNGSNEEYSECSYDCPPQTCESLDRAYVCPIIEGNDCKPMCRCKPGFFRNRNGQCITEKQCRRCMGPFEFYSCGGACDNVCATLHKQNQTICPIRNIKCNEMCYCENDYARAKNNTCIPISSCKEPQCPLNERYEQCPAASCEPQYCSQLGYPVPCPLPSPDGRCPGKPGCVCIDGYVRDGNGKCIPKEDCPSCGDDINAQSGCGVNCGKHCRDIGKTGVACIEICYPNACDCKAGYFYDSNQNKCVLPRECTDVNVCGKNEEFEDCSNPTCRVKNCTQLGFPFDCDSECVKGCICKEGFARNAKGICIPVKKCPSCGGDANAETGCGVNCLQNCDDLKNPQRPRPCPRICRVNACDCKKGYYLDNNTNKCVLPKECTQTCGKDEIYTSCVNGGCDKRNCSQLGQPQICIHPFKCFGGCICREGFLRLQNGTCVPYSQCPKPKCKKNERFELCPDKICQPQSCSELGFPLNCPAESDSCPGQPECICNYGYVRNERGVCRPKEECPSCGGDSNARPGCGINCGKRCPNNNLNPKLCPRICLPNACDCKDGFYYDKYVGLCVKFENCSPPCDELNNEEYDSCTDDGCGWTNCSQIGGSCIDPITCKKGCKCKEGYYRLNNGTCVPENQCPVSCRKPNEIYDPCPPKCPPQTCESINAKYFCPIQTTDCVGQCRCKPNFYRNKIGQCISKKNCLKCSGPNEFFSCGPACDNVCGKLDTESQFNCPIKNKKCVSRCYCVKGYARNNKGICIPIDQCSERGPVTSKPTSKPNPSGDTSVALANFKQGNQNLAAELLYQLHLSRPGDSFMVSGFSVLVALAQLVLSAEGKTAEQILRVMNLPDKYQVETVFTTLLENNEVQRDVIFKLGVRFYFDLNFPPSDEFQQDTLDVFGSKAQSLDFSENVKAAGIINDWVEETTNGLIQDLVKPDMLGSDTRCVLVNALYFLGNWEKQFNKNLTKLRDFYTDDKNSVPVNTMYQEGRFEYGESRELDCKLLRLRYKDGNFSYVAFLPNERTGLSGLLEKLRKPGVLANSLTLLNQETVQVFLPVMDIDTDISDLKTLLQKVNITAPFEPSNDLNGILRSGESLVVSDAIQKTKIKLDETGTEAAAATAMIIGVTSVLIPSEKFIFNCDHPYAFSLQLEDSPMFTGVYSGRN